MILEKDMKKIYVYDAFSNNLFRTHRHTRVIIFCVVSSKTTRDIFFFEENSDKRIRKYAMCDNVHRRGCKETNRGGPRKKKGSKRENRSRERAQTSKNDYFFPHHVDFRAFFSL